MTIEQAKSELMQIYGALSPNKQIAIDTVLHTIEQEPSNVMEHDKDHIWYKGKQYISLSRFLQVKEPCEDAISRQAVLDIINSDWKYEGMEQHINELPSVNPQEPKYCDRNICIKNEYNGIGCDECEVTKSQEPKIGRWIENAPEYQNIEPPYICSECGHSNLIKTNYCEQCGAKMVEPQESEKA